MLCVVLVTVVQSGLKAYNVLTNNYCGGTMLLVIKSIISLIILWSFLGAIVFFGMSWLNLSRTKKIVWSSVLGLILVPIFWYVIIFDTLCDDDYNLYILGFNFSYMC